MIDSYGDGWNGASIDVSINGAFVASFSNSSSTPAGLVETDTIGAFTGDSVSFSWTSGNYDGEITFEILDPNYTSLTGGYIPAPSAGFFLADANSPSVCAPPPPPACPAPTALTTANITDVSALISWTAGGTEAQWNIEYGAAGFTVGSGTSAGVAATSFSATGLTPNTSYDIYVQAVCGASLSNFAGPISITTLPTGGTCGFFTAEVFDSYGDGWNGNGLVVYVNGTVVDTLATTAADLTNGVQTLIPVDIGDVVDFLYVVDAYGTGSANTWVGENSYNVYDHAGILIAAAATGSDPATGGPVSSFGLTACPSCSAPNTLTASNITNTSADLAWVAGGSETAWNIEYGASGFAQGSGTTVAVTTNPYSLTGLTAATSYDYYIQADCGNGDTSIYVGPYTFGTTCNNDVAPYFENFDSGLSVCWTNPGTPQFGWTLDANGTPSGTTGPSDDMTGGGNYMYIETSSPRAPGDSALLFHLT